jgi:hypothetical protein
MKMKATLVIDTPAKNCDGCRFNYDMGIGCDALDDDLAYGGDRKEMQGETRPSWCPLDSKKNKAIPIEWIEKWLDKTTGTRNGEDISQLPEQLKFAIEMINLMEMDWEKEKE